MYVLNDTRACTMCEIDRRIPHGTTRVVLPGRVMFCPRHDLRPGIPLEDLPMQLRLAITFDH